VGTISGGVYKQMHFFGLQLDRHVTGGERGGTHKRGAYKRQFMVFMNHHVLLLVTFHSTHTNFCPYHVLHKLQLIKIQLKMAQSSNISVRRLGSGAHFSMRH